MKKNTILTILAVMIITLVGGFLRLYKITQNPPGLNGDEISFGYSAYSVLKTLHDENGKFLPLTFQSLGDYKNPFPAYLMIPSIKIFGLTDFAVRFPNALMGTISIPIFFLFLLDIFKNKKIAFTGSIFLCFSAWHIFYSRFAYETLTASLFVLLGIWFFIKTLDKNTFLWPILSAFFFILTMYTAFAPRLFIPIFVIAVLAFNIPKLKKNWKRIALFIVTCIILALPLIFITLFQGAGTRLQMVILTNDIEFSRYVILKNFGSISDLPLLFFFWVKRFLSYFDPQFLFFNGLEATGTNPIGLGIFYVFDLPFLIAGIASLIKSKIRHKEIFTIWIFTGLLPDSLTNNQKSTGRLLHLFPILIILTTLGAIELYSQLRRVRKIYLGTIILSIFGLFAALVLIHAALVISTDFPREKGEAFEEGLREAVYYVGSNQDRFKEIVFDPRHGTSAPNLISNPFLYVLFYTKYDPKIYQTEPKTYGTADNPYFHFGKYTTRYIDWQKDSDKKEVLFIGSPWSFPSDLRQVRILKTIYLSSGNPAYYIVETK